MKKENTTQNILLVAMAVAIVFMSVGFAGYVQKLNITGNVTAERALWSVHYDTQSYSETTGEKYVSATSHNETVTDWTFAVTLAPGEKYEATVNAVNEGTFDAKLKSITMSALTDAQKKYLTYTVNYNGTSYTASAENIDTILAKQTGNTPTSVPVKVTVEYVLPENASDLPTENATITLTASLNYEQA